MKIVFIITFIIDILNVTMKAIDAVNAMKILVVLLFLLLSLWPSLLLLPMLYIIIVHCFIDFIILAYFNVSH